MLKVTSQKILIIARGPSGSGKSTMVRELEERYGVESVSADKFFMQSGSYKFDPKKLKDAHLFSQSLANKKMASGEPVVIVDNTNAKFWEMKPYVKAATQYGYIVQFVEPSWDENLKVNGKWNVDFLEQLQQNKDRQDMNKSLDRSIIERQVSNYEYNPTVESVLNA